MRSRWVYVRLLADGYDGDERAVGWFVCAMREVVVCKSGCDLREVVC